MRSRVVVAVAAIVVAACSENPLAPSPASNGAPPAGASYATEVLVGAGDIGRCGSSGHEATARLLDGLSGTVFTAGDNAYPNGSADDYRSCYGPTWGRHRDRTRPSAGNHEYDTPGAAGYFGYFGSRAGPSGLGYYAYSLGAWRVIVLNSEIGASAGSAQASWLRAELAENQTSCTAAYWHRPFASSGPHGDNTDMRDLFRILYEGGVEFLVSGHDHLYERFSPMDPDGRSDQSRGVRQFVVGTGGTPLSQPATARANSEALGTSWGVIRFELSPGSYRWEFLPVEGQTYADTGFQACH
jgi:hypothetical protein